MNSSDTLTDAHAPKLPGTIALVTGAGGGLGHAIARRFATESATVVAVTRTLSELEELERSVVDAGVAGTIETLRADRGSPDEVARLAATVLERHGHLHVLVNNAAVLRMIAFLELPADAFDETIAVNLLALVQLTRAFLPGMIDQGSGTIINVTSRAGVEEFTLEADYCAAKFGLEGFTHSLALEIEGSRVATCLVTPGRSINPTSVTTVEWGTWPAEQRSAYADPMLLTDAFVSLALADPATISGKRFSARNRQEPEDGVEERNTL